MRSGKPDSGEIAAAGEGSAVRTVFDATITPHRSLSADGFRIVMTLVCLASVAASIPFIVLGAWPVAGFFGLDALALFIAFKVNFRAARAFERIVVTPLEVLLRKVSHHGKEAICAPTRPGRGWSAARMRITGCCG